MKTAVIGIGESGLKIISKLYAKAYDRADIIAFDTDMESLNKSKASKKILLKSKIAKINRIIIERYIEKYDYIIIAAAFGGMTGTSYTPAVANAANALNIKTTCIVSIPVLEKGEREYQSAIKNIDVLEKTCDMFMICSSQRMYEEKEEDEDEDISDVYDFANMSMKYLIEDILNIQTDNHGILDINTSQEELLRIIKCAGQVIWQVGRDCGEKRAINSARKAVGGLPFQGRIMESTKGIIVNVAGDRSITLVEIKEIIEYIRKVMPAKVKIFLSITKDEYLSESIEVTVMPIGYKDEDVIFLRK